MKSIKLPAISILLVIGFLLTANGLAQELIFEKHSLGTLSYAFAVHCIDFNKDGKIDILSGAQSDEIVIFTNNGNFSFTRKVIDTNLGTMWNVYGTDLDKDGDFDILASSVSKGIVLWCKNEGSSYFTVHIIDSDLSQTERAMAADFDNDNDNDVVSIGITNSVLVWYENDGHEQFTRRIISSQVGDPHYISLGDYNNDGYMDISCASGAGFNEPLSDMSWWKNEKNGTFSYNYVDKDFEGAYAVETVDFDNDGDLDLFGAAHAKNQIAWWPNKGNGVFGNKIEIGNNFLETHSAYPADINGDGKMDAVGASEDLHEIAWWENKGNNSFEKHSISTELVQAHGAAAADFNNDGRIDIVGTDRLGHEIAIWENLGHADFQLTILVNPPQGGSVIKNLDRDMFVEGEKVILTAIPDTGYTFLFWNGMGGDSTANPREIIMFKNRTITANFVPSNYEFVSAPNKPAGPVSGTVGQMLTFTTGGAYNNYGHLLEYRFDWGNGNQSSWSSASRTYSYAIAGSFQIRAQARCKTHIEIISDWSSSLTVNIQPLTGSNPVHILPLGDSITMGKGDPGVDSSSAFTGYRDDLYYLLINNGWNPDFVGGLADGNPLQFDVNHEGHAAYRANQVDAELNSWLSLSKPDIVLLHIGTNDISAGDTPQNVRDDVERIVDKINAYNSGIAVLLCKLIPRLENIDSEHLRNQELNNLIENLYANKKQQGQNIYLVDQFSQFQANTNWRTAYMYDDIHPNSLGNNMMAQKFFEVLQEIKAADFQLIVKVMPEMAGKVQYYAKKAGYSSGEQVELCAISNSLNGELAGNIYIEAETGDLSGNFMVAKEATASKDFYLYGKEGTQKDGNASYRFTIQQGGNYYIWGRCYALTDVEDSFYLLSDGAGDPLTWHLKTDYGVWQWQLVSHQNVVRQFYYNAGEHEITVIKRDPNCRLDKLILTRDSQFRPSGKQELPAAAVSYTFNSWGGDLSGNVNPLFLVMNGHKEVTANFRVTGEPEMVSVPATPIGANRALLNELISFSSGGSVSNFGDAVEYQFDFGDGAQSGWGDSSATHSYSSVGTYHVRARARCQLDTLIISNWSAGHMILISQPTAYSLNIAVYPVGVASVTEEPYQELYNNGTTVRLKAIPFKSSTEDIHIEAEQVNLKSPLAVGSSTAASGGAYIYGAGGTPQQGSAEYIFSIKEAGNYVIWGRCYALSGTEDSYFVRVDGDIQLMTWHLNTTYNKWLWQKVTDSGAPKIFYFSAGVHTIQIVKRDLNARLDKLIITKNLNFVPVGLANGTETYQFNYWSGDLSGSTNPDELMMNGNKKVTAYFRTETDEVVTVPTVPSGPDLGYVGQTLIFSTGGSTSSLGYNVEYQFDWGDSSLSSWSANIRDYVYNSSKQINVRARARSKGDTLVTSEWSAAHPIVIEAVPPAMYTLEVTVDPAPAGSVFMLPDKANYFPGDVVTLTAEAGQEFTFESWSGDLAGSQNPASITMSSNKNITANFIQASLEQISLPLIPVGPDTGFTNEPLNFTAHGARSNFGSEVEYQFDWGDGTLSAWGDSSGYHHFPKSGVFSVRLRARSKVNQDAISNWSDTLRTAIDACCLEINLTEKNAGIVCREPDQTNYDFGAKVKLQVFANENFQFLHWNDDVTDTATVVVIEMTGNRKMNAVFESRSLVDVEGQTLPKEFVLKQNYPNPFNPETTIEYSLAKNCHVQISIYNVNGQLIDILVDEEKVAGNYSVIWEALDQSRNRVPSGIYMYQIK